MQFSESYVGENLSCETLLLGPVTEAPVTEAPHM